MKLPRMNFESLCVDAVIRRPEWREKMASLVFAPWQGRIAARLAINEMSNLALLELLSEAIADLETDDL